MEADGTQEEEVVAGQLVADTRNGEDVGRQLGGRHLPQLRDNVRYEPKQKPAGTLAGGGVSHRSSDTMYIVLSDTLVQPVLVLLLCSACKYMYKH